MKFRTPLKAPPEAVASGSGGISTTHEQKVDDAKSTRSTVGAPRLGLVA